MDVGTLGSKEHIDKCLATNITCPLQCGQIIKSLEHGLDHFDKVCTEALIICQYCRSAVLKRSMMASHHNYCEQYTITCPIVGCSAKFKRIELNFHLDKCDFSEVSCGHCSVSFKRKDLEEHTRVCPEISVPCEKCGTLAKRKNLGNHSCTDALAELVQKLKEESEGKNKALE